MKGFSKEKITHLMEYKRNTKIFIFHLNELFKISQKCVAKFYYNF